MKQLVSLIGALACMACAACSSGFEPGAARPAADAGKEDATAIVLSVPEGWTADYGTPGRVTLMAGAGVMAISLENTRGMEAAVLASSLASVMQGTAPLEDEGAYLFTIRNPEREGLSGEEMPVLLRADGDRAVLLFLYDPEQQLLPLARTVLDSVLIP